MIPATLETVPHLLAIDLGLRFAWSLYTLEGILLNYSSHHCPNYASLKRFAYLMFSGIVSLFWRAKRNIKTKTFQMLLVRRKST